MKNRSTESRRRTAELAYQPVQDCCMYKTQEGGDGLRLRPGEREGRGGKKLHVESGLLTCDAWWLVATTTCTVAYH